MVFEDRENFDAYKGWCGEYLSNMDTVAQVPSLGQITVLPYGIAYVFFIIYFVCDMFDVCLPKWVRNGSE